MYVAGFWRRMVATTIDALLLLPVLGLSGWAVFHIIGLSAQLPAGFRIESLVELLLEKGNLLGSLLAIGLLILLLYGFLFMATTGATPGLRVVKLRVINVYGNSPEWWRAMLRCSGFLASIVSLGLGFLWIGFDREKRGLHDWIAGTYVIRFPGHSLK